MMYARAMALTDDTIRLFDPARVRRLADPADLEPRSIAGLVRTATAAGFGVLTLELVVATPYDREVMVLGIHDERGWFRAYWRAVTPKDGSPSPAALKPDAAVLRPDAGLPRPVGVTELAAWVKAASS